jgi:DNA-directed RNA polymerase subunit F
MNEQDKQYARFLAACFALLQCGIPKKAVEMADQLIKELDDEKVVAGGIVDIVPKRRSRSNR